MLERVLEPEVMDTEEDASEYDAMDHTEANAAFVERLVTLDPGGRMLDVGTGPGHIPLLVVERVADAEVIAIDLAERMLAIARRYVEASPHAARVRLEKADAKALRYPDAHFDFVYSNTILHHVPEPLTMLREVQRVLKPGGGVLIRDLMRPGSKDELERLVGLHAADATPYQRDLFAASLHAALTPAELTEVARAAGLEDCEVTVDSDRHLSLQRRREA